MTVLGRSAPGGGRAGRAAGGPGAQLWASAEPVLGSSPQWRGGRGCGTVTFLPGQPSPAQLLPRHRPLPMTPALPEGRPDAGSALFIGSRGGLDPGGPSVPGRTVTGQVGQEPDSTSMEAQEALPSGPRQVLCPQGLVRAKSATHAQPAPTSALCSGKVSIAAPCSVSPVQPGGLLPPSFIEAKFIKRNTDRPPKGNNSEAPGPFAALGRPHSLWSQSVFIPAKETLPHPQPIKP